MDNLTDEDLYLIKSRLPKIVLEAMKLRRQKVFLAGGFIRAVIAKEDIADIDLFTTSLDEANSLANELKVAAGESFIKIVATENAVTLLGLKYPVQIIHRWTFANPADCVESFDFTVAKAAMWFEDRINNDKPVRTSVCHPLFYADLAAKRLRYTSPVRDEEAGGSMLRLVKFSHRGYHPMLDSLAAVVARLVGKIDYAKTGSSEQQIAFVISGLLREVDPSIPEQ